MVKMGKGIERQMYFGANPTIIMRARELRRKMTPSESTLWQRLRKKQIEGAIFRRQHPINIYIADFYCHEHKLVIEVDGEIHDVPIAKERDEGRTAELERLGLRVIRFKNYHILHQMEDVIETIRQNIIH